MKVYNQLKQLNKLPPKIVPIYDLGCGDGRIAKPFYDDGYKIVGIDAQENKILEARKAMPGADLRIGSLLEAEIPAEAFIIARNSLPFIKDKEKILGFIRSLSAHSIYFTLFGEADEQVIKGNAVAFTRAEVDALIKQIGPITRFSETIGESTNLKGKPRQSHVFEIIRIL